MHKHILIKYVIHSFRFTSNSVVIIELTEREYQVREGQGSNVIVARISYSRDIVNPITLRFFPVTYTEYSARSFTLSPDFPAREEGPEFEAGGKCPTITATFHVISQYYVIIAQN